MAKINSNFGLIQQLLLENYRIIIIYKHEDHKNNNSTFEYHFILRKFNTETLVTCALFSSCQNDELGLLGMFFRLEDFILDTPHYLNNKKYEIDEVYVNPIDDTVINKDPIWIEKISNITTHGPQIIPKNSPNIERNITLQKLDELRKNKTDKIEN